MPPVSSRRRAAWIVGLLVVVAIPLIPDLPDPVERPEQLDIELVRAAECRYRGITASFEEVSRAYALTTYADAELLEWSSRPNPAHPEAEALVRCRFSVSGLRADAPEARDPEIAEHRAAVDDILDVTWKLNTVSAVQVRTHSATSEDALDVFRGTVNRLLDRMVYSNATVEMFDAPDGVAIAQLGAGTVLLRESTEGLWSYVRVPSDTTAGWVADEHLRPVSNAQSD